MNRHPKYRGLIFESDRSRESPSRKRRLPRDHFQRSSPIFGRYNLSNVLILFIMATASEAFVQRRRFQESPPSTTYFGVDQYCIRASQKPLNLVSISTFNYSPKDHAHQYPEESTFHKRKVISANGKPEKHNSQSSYHKDKRAQRHHGVKHQSKRSTSSALGHKKRIGKQRSKPAIKSSKTAISFNKQISHILKHERYSRRAVEKVDSMLWKRVKPIILSNGNSPVGFPDRQELPFDLVSFNIIMLAWSRQESWEGAERAREWLQRLWSMSPVLQADSYSYGAVLNAMAKAKSTKAAIAAQALLEQCLPSMALTTDSLHNAVMDAWARSGHPQAGDRAFALLRQLQHHQNVEPTLISFNTCIKAYASSSHPEKALKILHYMKSPSVEAVRPNKVSYTTVINAFAQLLKDQQQTDAKANDRRIYAIVEIRRLLDEMENAYVTTRNQEIRPDIYTYTAVLSARAIPPLELYSRMNKIDPNQVPNAAFLNTCIHLLGQALEKRINDGETTKILGGNDDLMEAATTAQVAETLLRQMQHQEHSKDKRQTQSSSNGTKACKVTYTAVIQVWAQVGTVEAAQRAEGLLDELEKLWETTRQERYLPSAKTFCSVLTAWIKVASGTQSDVISENDSDDALSIIDHAFELQRRMHRLYQKTKCADLAPNPIIFVQIFQLLAKTRNPAAALRAKELLEIMDGYASNGHKEVRPDSTILGSFLNTLTKSGVENIVELATMILDQVEEGYSKGIGHLKPSSLLYSAVLQAYGKSASQEGAILAEKLLERTKRLYREGKVYAKPTVLFYNAVIDALARSNGGMKAATRAEELLDELWTKAGAGDPTLFPTIRTYNAVLLAWKNSNVSDAAQRAEAVLQVMIDRFEDGQVDCRPDRVTMNSIVATWAKSPQEDAPELAKKVLLDMEQQCKSGEARLQPDRITFNSCIDAYARRGMAIEAKELFDHMMHMHDEGFQDVAPDQITLSSLRAAFFKSSLPESISKPEMAQIEKRIATMNHREQNQIA